MNYQKLFDHMFQEHGLTLTEGEMQDIIHQVKTMQPTTTMKAPHTKEPWFAVEYAGFITIQDGPYYENRNLLDCSNFKGQDVFDEETIKANGERIVECVNAMAGIEKPAEYIKSMQEDHEKELIEAIEFVEKKATDGANEMVKRLGLLGRVTPTPTQDLLTQFRNKQQDR